MQTLMRDVAEKAGVSITTVSHVLNNTRPVAEATRDRVLSAVNELRYVQNSSARSLVQGSSRVLGLMISDIENPFFTQLIQGFNQACQASRLELVLAMTNYSQDNAEAAIRRMIEDRARGVAIMSSQVDPALVERLLTSEIPVVMLDEPKLGRNKSSMRIDYSIGIEQAIKRLRALGHRSIALIEGPSRRISVQRYRAIVLQKIREYDMRLTGTVEGNYTPEGGAAALEELLARKTRPSAILCANDLMAIGTMSEATRLGLAVPGDLSVVGADDIAFATYSQPSLSTIRIPLREIGRSAFETLNNMLGDPARRGVEVPVVTEFISRDSIGPLRTAAGRP